MKKMITIIILILFMTITVSNAKDFNNENLIMIAEQMVSDAQSIEEYEIAINFYMFVLNPEFITTNNNPTGKFNFGKSKYELWDFDKNIWKRIN